MTLADRTRPGTTTRVRARFYAADTVPGGRVREETLVTEEPMEIRLGDRRLSVTMRTPGADFELAAGLLHGEGIVRSADDVSGIRYCIDPGLDDEQRYNVVTVDLAPDAAREELIAAQERSLLTTSACGVCGKQSLESLRARGAERLTDEVLVAPDVLVGLSDLLRSQQRLFDRTGGLHAAGLFTADGRLLAVREDVGRHNAVDKLVGWALLERRLPLRGCVLLVSGRTSYEIAQKAVAAGVPVVAAVSAPSSLAVAVAEEYGVTLVGFVRDRRFTVYAGAQRVGATSSSA